MARRKSWDELRPDYRERLEKKGITREAHERGDSIKAARGHERTPESPKRYNPEKYQRYHENRADLERRLIQRKEDLFSSRPPRAGGRPGFSSDRSARNIRDHPPTMAQLRWALDAEEEDLINALREDPETFAFLGYS